MLHCGTNNRFAHEHNPERERRLAWFANAKDDDEQFERMPDGTLRRKDTHEVLNPIEAISAGARSKVERLRQPISKAILNSPFVLRQIADSEFVTGETRQVLLNRADVLSTGKPATGGEQEIEAILVNSETDVSHALSLAAIFDRRAQAYQKHLGALENVSVHDLVRLEKKLSLAKRLDLIGNPDSWNITEVREMLTSLGVTFSNEEKEVLLRKLYNLLRSSRELSAMETNDLGSKFSIEDTEATTEAFDKQALHSRKYLDILLQEKTPLLTEARSKLQKIDLEYSHNPERIVSELGVSAKAFRYRITDLSQELTFPTLQDSEFISKAEVITKAVHQAEWIRYNSDTKILEGLFGKESDYMSLKNKHTQAVTWAKNQSTKNYRKAAGLIESGEASLAFLNKDHAQMITEMANLCERAQGDELTFEDHDDLYDLFEDPNWRARVEQLVTIVQNQTLGATITNVVANVEQKEMYEANQEKLSEELNEVSTALLSHPLLKHEVCATLGIEEQLQKRIRETKSYLLLIGVEGDNGRKSLNALKTGITILQQTVVKLNQVQEQDSSTSKIKRVDGDEYRTIAGADTFGFYNQTDGCIYLNTSKQEEGSEKERATLHHEQGHAIVDILSKQTAVLPHILVCVERLLNEPTGNGDEKFEDLLLQQAREWQLEGVYEIILVEEQEKFMQKGMSAAQAKTEAVESATQRYKEMLADELVNKYASHLHRKNGATLPLSKNVERLFRLFEGVAPHRVNIGLHDSGLDDTDEASAAPLPPSEDINSTIRGVKHTINFIRNFIVARKGDLSNYNEWNTWVENSQKMIDGLEHAYLHENDVDKSKAIVRKIKDLEEKIDKNNKIIGTYIQFELDLTNVAPTGQTGFTAVWNSIQWMSLWDMGQMVNSAREDILHMWKRRGEKVQAKVGEATTKWLSKSGIPFLNELADEFGRRSNASELEEVKHWKDSLEDYDSYVLQEMLGHMHNPDIMRAIIELLVSRGRLDWNDTHFWHALDHISNYSMPIDACKNDDVLRDKWLLKIMTDIWNDKEHFYQWRRENDSNYDSGMSKFTQQVDQLSNVSKGLDGELERELRLWKEHKDSHKPYSELSSEVNPHKYEKVLMYAIENGKMTMEQKVYYLVQGVATELISIDRLRVLAGETGGVLNKFPILDYFYKKNNTLPEVIALANRLEEKGENKYKPGSKTTLWIHLEALRDEGTRQRFSKASSGTRLENIDHEDIPTVITTMDYQAINAITGAISGDRMQLSPEARKNAYTGFGTKFLALSRLAQLDKDGISKFSESDALELAKSITSAIHYDNIITGSTDENKRAKLGWEEINQTKAISSEGHLVKDVRNGSNDFIKAILNSINFDWKAFEEKIGYKEPEIGNWKWGAKEAARLDEVLETKFSGKSREKIQKHVDSGILHIYINGVETTDLNTAVAEKAVITTKEDKVFKVTREDYFKPNDDPRKPREDIFNATKVFSSVLAEQLRTKVPQLKDALLEAANSFDVKYKAKSTERLISENDAQLKYGEVKKFFTGESETESGAHATAGGH